MSNDPISSLKGLEPAIKEKLEDEGITNTQQLLTQAGTYAQRQVLATRVGTTPQAIKELVNRADLMRLKGVGGNRSDLLEEAGVNSCKELQRRIPDSLYRSLTELQHSRKIAHHTPTLAQVTEWIIEAKELAPTSPE
jgi:predicted flap endonuclease-1-like 5' DNA nuclease